MRRLIVRQLLLDPLRTLLTTGALAAVVAAILVLEGFNEGLIEQLGNAVIERDADLVATQAGIANMTGTRSVLPQFARGEVEAVAGVAVAHPLTGIPAIYSRDDVRTPIFLLVYDSAGGPARLDVGRAPTEARDIVVDRSLAVKYDLEVGDPLVLSDFEFRVSGIAHGAAAMFTAFAFARYDDLIDFYMESDLAADITTFPLLSFLLIELQPDADRTTVAAAIESAVPSADVLLPEVLAKEDEKLGRVIFGPIMRLLIGVGYLIGVLVSGIIMFAVVNGRRSDLGVMKALGFTNAFLGRSVVLEALTLSVVAIPVGVLLAALISEVIERYMPLYSVLATNAGPVLRTAVASLTFTTLGALVPIRTIRRVDPCTVFRT